MVTVVRLLDSLLPHGYPWLPELSISTQARRLVQLGAIGSVCLCCDSDTELFKISYESSLDGGRLYTRCHVASGLPNPQGIRVILGYTWPLYCLTQGIRVIQGYMWTRVTFIGGLGTVTEFLVLCQSISQESDLLAKFQSVFNTGLGITFPQFKTIISLGNPHRIISGSSCLPPTSVTPN